MSAVVAGVHVAGLALDHGIEVLGPTLDPTTMPWFDGHRDHFASTPNVASAITAAPFADRAMWLEPGIHLHWTLPSVLTRGSTRRTATCSVRHGDLWFPPAPNRWLVVELAAAAGEFEPAAWVIESDYVHPERHRARPARAVPHLLEHPSRQRPWVLLGRQTEVRRDAPWREIASDQPDRFLTGLGAPLTAIGSGDPTSAALYATSFSTFGAHIPLDRADIGSLNTRHLAVVGWYGPSVTDPLAALLDELSTWTSSQRLARLNAARVLAAAAPHPAETTLTAADELELQRAVVAERLGVPVEQLGAGQPMPRRLLCAGMVGITPSDTGSPGRPPAVVSEPVSLGASATEAFAVHIARAVGDPQLEDRLEALELGTVTDEEALDLVTTFAAHRHRHGFTEAGRHRTWTIRAAHPGGADAAPEQSPPVSDALAHAVRQLERLQEDYEVGADRLDSLRQRLFGDWHRYMIAATPPGDPDDPAVDLDSLLAVVRDHALPAVEQAAVELGDLDLRRHEVRGTWTVDHRADGSLAASIVAKAAEVSALLADENVRRTPEQQLELAMVPGPGFWRPSDPTIVLDHERARTRHGQLRSGAMGQPGEPFAFVWNELEIDDALTEIDGPRPLVGVVGLLEDTLFAHGWEPYQGDRSWNAVALDWEVGVESLAAHGNQGRHRDDAGAPYDARFVAANTLLGDDDVDLTTVLPAPLSPAQGTVVGRTVLVGGVADTVTERLTMSLRPLVERVAAARADGGDGDDVDRAAIDSLREAQAYLDGDGRDLTVATLGGFHDGLLSTVAQWQLPIADPLGFAPEQALAARVRTALGGLHPRSPAPHAPFHPVRSGELVVERVRLVDTFGQTMQWQPRQVWGAGGFADVDAPQRCRLPVRLAQAARVEFRWLTAADGLAEMSDHLEHPTSNPVCGWLVPNDLDGSIAVYGASGRLLGAVDDRHGRWTPAPGDRDAPLVPETIPNPYLADLVGWIVHGERSPADVVTSMLASIETSLDAIDPPIHAQHTSRAAYLGRPLAVVRARAGFRLRGLPELDQSWEAVRHRLTGTPDMIRPADHGLGAIRLPLRIGVHAAHGDGVVGIWSERGPGDLGEVMHAPHGRSVVNARSATASVGRNVAVAPVMWRTLTDADLVLTMLVDPRAAIHVTTGLLPTELLRIPPNHFTEVLATMRITFPASPVLTPPTSLEIPLPHEPGTSWAWLERGRTGWVEQPEEPLLAADDLERVLPGRGAQLWRRLQRDGLIVDVDATTGRGRFRPPSDPAAANGPAQPTSEERRAIETASVGVRPASTRARFADPAVIRDGWVQVRTRRPGR